VDARAGRLVCALDLSLRVGFAVGRDFEKPICGVWKLGEDTADLGRCFSCLAQSLEDAIAVHQPDLVIMESPLPPQAQTAMVSARLQFGLAAVTEMICFERGVPCEEERADVARKRVMGHGHPKKDQIVDWCRSQGWSPPDHNAADSLVLLRYRHILSRTRVTAGDGSAQG
jgi:Holliday junction resolvasome RuvABC endonuclease subunit